MSVDGPPPEEEDEDEEEDNQHKAWETRAAIAHLLGLCEALETVERSAGAGDHRLTALSARRPSVKGKEREGSEVAAGRAAGTSPLQALVRAVPSPPPVSRPLSYTHARRGAGMVDPPG
jgi:hypothetical protein